MGDCLLYLDAIWKSRATASFMPNTGKMTVAFGAKTFEAGRGVTVVMRSSSCEEICICSQKTKRERIKAVNKEIRSYIDYKKDACYEVKIRKVEKGDENYEMYERWAS